MKQTTQTRKPETDLNNLEQPPSTKPIHKKLKLPKTVETNVKQPQHFFKERNVQNNERYSCNRVTRSWRGNEETHNPEPTNWRRIWTLATDEVPGERRCVGDGRSCFWTWEWQRENLAVQTIQEPPSEEKKKAKEKRQMWIQRNRKSVLWWRASTGLGMEVRRILCLVVQRKSRSERLFER